MRTLSWYVLAVLASGLPLTALAIEAPQLPTSAKKLTGKEIVELQDGVTLTFKDYTTPTLLTGAVVHDFKNKSESGTFEYKGIKGQINSTIWLKEDMLCDLQPGKGDVCSFVYLDGSSFYNVGPDGKVRSVDTKQ
jgi:hypothetical protein